MKPASSAIMMPADLQRLRRYMLDINGIDQISDEMPAVSKSYGRTWCAIEEAQS